MADPNRQKNKQINGLLKINHPSNPSWSQIAYQSQEANAL